MNLNSTLQDALGKAETGTLKADTFYAQLAVTCPGIFTFLFDADTKFLLEREHDFMLFIAMLCLESMRSSGIDLDNIEPESLEEMAEHNWGLIEHTSIENITETLSAHPGFDLYAFLEESCTPEKAHEILTETATELVYVKCKSLIDSAFHGG